MSYEIRTTDVFDGLAAMPEKSVHCCVTSPPYWALRDYGVPGQLGQEATPQEFVATLVRVFAGVHRVLRDDGVLFVNLGDSYAGSWGNYGGKNRGKGTQREIVNGSQVANPAYDESTGIIPATAAKLPGIKPKDRCLIPERFVLAMQEFGWYVRDIIIWHKPSPMPVSVRDRCTPAWEPIYQFTKSPRYFWDQEAVKVPGIAPDGRRRGPKLHTDGNYHRNGIGSETLGQVNGSANPRNVWRISTEPLKAKHYAAFPSELPTRCIKAATSERGVCSRCLAPWVRVVERKRVATRPGEDSKVLGDVSEKNQERFDTGMQRRTSTLASVITGNRDPQRHCTTTRTVDWKPSCQCNADTIPATVLDPFSGAGTTCLAAARLGRHGIGLELNPEYVTLSIQRIETELAKHAAKTTMVRPAKVASQPGAMDLFATLE